MYFMADMTVGTMANLIGFDGFLNTSAPFTLDEYNAKWLHPKYMPWNFTEYKDFSVRNAPLLHLSFAPSVDLTS